MLFSVVYYFSTRRQHGNSPVLVLSDGEFWRETFFEDHFTFSVKAKDEKMFKASRSRAVVMFTCVHTAIHGGIEFLIRSDFRLLCNTDS